MPRFLINEETGRERRDGGTRGLGQNVTDERCFLGNTLCY